MALGKEDKPKPPTLEEKIRKLGVDREVDSGLVDVLLEIAARLK